MNKKKLIIIAVVAVLLYLLYKKGVFKSLTGGESSSETATGSSAATVPTSVDKNNTDSIIAGTSMSQTLQKECKGFVKHINSIALVNTKEDKGWTREKLLESAQKAGITYEQELVVSAIWQMYVTKGTLTQAQCNTYMDEVRDM